jgi:hypothetical protein
MNIYDHTSNKLFLGAAMGFMGAAAGDLYHKDFTEAAAQLTSALVMAGLHAFACRRERRITKHAGKSELSGDRSPRYRLVSQDRTSLGDKFRQHNKPPRMAILGRSRARMRGALSLVAAAPVLPLHRLG